MAERILQCQDYGHLWWAVHDATLHYGKQQQVSFKI